MFTVASYLQRFWSALLIEGLPNDVLTCQGLPRPFHCTGKIGMGMGNQYGGPRTTPVPIRSSRVPPESDLFHNSDLVKFNALEAGSVSSDSLPVFLRLPIAFLGLYGCLGVSPPNHRHVR